MSMSTAALNSLTSVVLLGVAAVLIVGAFELARVLRIHWRLAGAVQRDRAVAAGHVDRQAELAAEQAQQLVYLITDAPLRAFAAAA